MPNPVVLEEIAGKRTPVIGDGEIRRLLQGNDIGGGGISSLVLGKKVQDT